MSDQSQRRHQSQHSRKTSHLLHYKVKATQLVIDVVNELCMTNWHIDLHHPVHPLLDS